MGRLGGLDLGLGEDLKGVLSLLKMVVPTVACRLANSPQIYSCRQISTEGLKERGCLLRGSGSTIRPGSAE